MLARVASIFALSALSVAPHAQDPVPVPGEAPAAVPRVTWTSGGAGSAIRLTAARAPVDEILDVIERRTGTHIHRNSLSGGPVSLVCEESDFRQLLGCVLGPDADLVIRAAANARQGVLAWPDEVWVVSHSAQPAIASALGDGNRRQSASEPRTIPDSEMARWMTLANSAEPEARAQGLQRIAGQANGDDDLSVRGMLQDALVDGDAEARAQAVFGLARNGGNEAIAVLEQALLDQDASVRLMAVDSIDGSGDGSALLKAALNDADETVRGLATMKLERLSADATVGRGLQR